MEDLLPDLTFVGAEVPGEDGLARADVTIAAGRLTDTGAGKVVDLTGYWILPGIVDIHGDGFERHLAPRRGAAIDMADGLAALEAELGACGITTAWLAQFWSWEGGMRGPGFARALATALSGYAARADLRMQLRLELGCHADFAQAADLIEAQGIDCVVFNDHLPHDHVRRGARPPSLEGQALKAGRSPEAHRALIEALSAGIDEAPAVAAALVARIGPRARFGSHDDPDADTRAAFRSIGCTLAEFPLTAAAARDAAEAGDPVILGAPNVVRGGSHKKRGMAAGEVVAAGLCTALASDYHYPAPLQAARRLVADGIAVAEAWALVSAGPARAMGLEDRGRIAPGLRADLVIVEPGPGRVCATIAGGRLSYLAGPVAGRFL